MADKKLQTEGDCRIQGFPRIEDTDGNLAFGGSQDWYTDTWMRMAGCASVAAANLAAFYGLGSAEASETALPQRAMPVRAEENETETKVQERKGSGRRVYGREEFLGLMKQMYGLMKPGALGFPYVRRFRDNFVRFAKARGVCLQGETMGRWKDPAVPLAFIRRSLSGNDPVALLILRHKSRRLDHLTWHWMTITGYSEKTGTLTISNYGHQERIPADILLEPSFSNEVKLAAFHRLPSPGPDSPEQG